MKLAGYLKTSLLDWPGKVVSVVWTRGCNLRCSFCHNGGLVVGNGKKDVDGETILKDLEGHRKWVDGLVITGGEPTLHKGLGPFCERVKALGLAVKLDTNGTNYTILKELNLEKLVDFVALDIKSDWKNYAKMVGKRGVDVKSIKKSLELILGSGLEYELRTTVVPGLHNEQILMKMVEEIDEVWKRAKMKKPVKWVWQNFRGGNCLDDKFDDKKGYTLVAVEAMRKKVEEIGIAVKLRGWS